MSTDHPRHDPLEEAANLIRDVGQRAQDARRYRDLRETIAELAFDRALAIGSEVRRVARGPSGDSERALEPLLRELRELLARTETAVASLRNSETYRAAATAFRRGDAARVATLAGALFSEVASVVVTGPLYVPVLITEKRSASHFLPAIGCADLIQDLIRGGVPAPSRPAEFGGDDIIRPVILTDEHDVNESPIALVFTSAVLPAPHCRVAGSNTLLFYAERLHATATVHCVRSVNDEWWNIRPDAYDEYLREIREALASRSIRVEIEAGDR